MGKKPSDIIKKEVKVGEVLQNPGGGTSKITKIGENSIAYIRG